MRRVVEGLALFALVAAVGCSGDGTVGMRAAPGLTATIAPDSAGLGDAVRLRLEAVLPAGAVPAFPGDSDSIGAWKILRASASEEGGSGPWRRWVRELTITGFRLGWIGPDSLYVLARRADGESLVVSCEAPGLLIGGQLGDSAAVDPSGARDIRDVVSTRAPRWPWIAGAAAVLLAGAVYLIRRLRARRRPAGEAAEPPGPSPQEEFEAAITRLLASGLLEQGLYREFYYGISSAVRRYLERVHGLPLLESSSGEVAALLMPKLRGEGEHEALHAWLREGDLVKYARMERLQAEALQYLERSRKLVDLIASSMVVGSVAGGVEA